jgi:hypothetical protein
MIILIKLILAHLMGDFILQPKYWVAEKEQHKIKSKKLYIHLLIHGLLVFLFLWDINQWLLPLLIMVLHGIIDILKLYGQKEHTKSVWFLADQSLHILSILVIWLLFFKPDLHVSTYLSDPKIWIYTTASFL